MELKQSNSGRSSLRDYHHHNNNNYQSFSSTLLEEVYRSFDEEREDRSENYRMMKMKKSSSLSDREKDFKSRPNSLVVNQWIENEKINLRRKSTAAIPSAEKFHRPIAVFNSSSSTSSSDSSSGIGGFSSSDTESLYGSAKPKQKIPTQLKPIRTTPEIHRKTNYSDEIPAEKKKNNNDSKKEGNFHRRALKLYGDLKKVKQPISPGGKLSNFLNSIFNSNSSKKPKISSSSSTKSSNGPKLSSSTPSTASSYSRSCLSKTPSSAGKYERRSVKFCPVNVIVDDENSAKLLTNDEEFKRQLMEKQRRVEEVAKELLKKYHHRNNELTVNIVGDNRKFENNIIRSLEDEEEEDEDDVSCCSSDLFELENFLEIGDHRYREELPVYETTHVHTNRAIASGFVM